MAASSRPDESGQSGFTLIEMMIVVAIVAVLAAIAVPSFSDFFAKSRVKDASRAIHTFLAQAKSEGVIRDQDIYVSIQGGANWCLGFIPDPDGATTCDCTDSPASCEAPVSGTNVTQVVSSADFPNVAVTSNFGGSTSFDRLRSTAAAGTLEVISNGWGVQTIVSTVGRVRTCAPTGQAYKGVTGFEDC